MRRTERDFQPDQVSRLRLVHYPERPVFRGRILIDLQMIIREVIVLFLSDSDFFKVHKDFETYSLTPVSGLYKG